MKILFVVRDMSFIEPLGVMFLSAIAKKEGHESYLGIVNEEDVLAKIDKYLALAGTNKSKLLTALIYVSEISRKPEMNEVWTAWTDPQNRPTRACVSADMDDGADVEIVVTAAK